MSFSPIRICSYERGTPVDLRRTYMEKAALHLYYHDGACPHSHPPYFPPATGVHTSLLTYASPHIGDLLSAGGSSRVWTHSHWGGPGLP